MIVSDSNKYSLVIVNAFIKKLKVIYGVGFVV